MTDHVKRDASPGLLGQLIRRGRRDASRTSIAFAVVAGFVALTTGIAFAFWTTTGSGTATASTGTLNPPTGTHLSNTAGSGTVNISWTAPGAGATPSGYKVSRTATGGSPVSVCGTGTTLVTVTSCSDTSVPDGTYTYVVTSILGGWTAAGSAAGPVTVTNTIATTTSLVSSANPSVVGQTVTYTATVTQASGSTKPTGSVTFKDGSSTISCTGGTQTLSAGIATCSLAYSSVGSHSITAVYAGSAPFTGSSSTPALAQAVNAASTATTLSSSTNPSVTGQTVTFTATVAAAAPGTGIPTGTVTFKDGTTTLCAGQTLDGSGQATCTLPFASAGAKSVIATYNGSTSYLTSSSASLSQTVSSASTTTTVSSSALASKTGQQVTYTATVAPVAPGAGTPTGTVAFKDNGTTITSCATQTLSGGTATCVVTYSSIGSHPITAVYSGGTDFTTSTSSSITQVVSAASTTTSLTSSPNPSVTGQTVTLTATVAAVSPGAGTPTGTVAFKDGGTNITGCGSQSLNGSGVATCQTTFNVSAGRTLTATYAGTADYSGSTSANLTQVTNQAATSTVVTSSKNPQKTGSAVTYTATVSTTLPGTGTPTGTVTFKDGGSTISGGCTGQALNASGVATCTVSSYPSTGSHNITAVYNADVNYAGSTSPTLTQRIVSNAVTGLGFTNVKVNNNAVTPTCTGLGSANVVCTVSGGNSASLDADVRFVNGSNALTAYSVDSVTGSTAVETKNGTTNGTVTFAPAGTGSPTISGAKSGNDHVYFTVTFSDGLNTFSAILKMD